MAKIAAGMSGGVDSAVAAWLLKQEGHEVIGVTLKTWKDGEDPTGSRRREIEDAERCAAAIGIGHCVEDVSEEFRERVMKPFAEEYLRGRTPNPCVMCNPSVKWQGLLRAADRCGAQLCATGHYAEKVQLDSGRLTIRRGVQDRKDQSYMLCLLSQQQLARTIFPLAGRTKDEVRRLAAQAGIPVSDKPDSQEICFVPEGDYADFIERESGVRMPEGNFVTPDGRVLGRHRGILHYTVGQRRGLGIPAGERCYVTQLRPERNEVVVGGPEDLLTSVVRLSHVNFLAEPGLEEGRTLRALGRIRYHHPGTMATLRMEPAGTAAGTADGTAAGKPGGRLIAEFDTPVRAAAPGQAAVFYRDGLVVCGGIIALPAGGSR